MSAPSTKSVAKSVIGWLIVALVAFWLLDVVVGTVRFVVRFLFWIVVIGLLVVFYFRLSGDDDGVK